MTFRGEMSVLRRVRYDSSIALVKLQKDGINNAENVQQYKLKIRELIGVLEKEVHNDRSGKIDCEMAILEDSIILVDTLIEYEKNPTIEKAEHLRGLALSDGTIKEFIRNEMNKQKDKQFKFFDSRK